MKTSAKKKEYYWVYTVSSEKEGLVYVGVGKLKDIFSFNAIKFHKDFNNEEDYDVETIDCSEDKASAVRKAKVYLGVYGNLKFNVPTKKVIRCLTTGEVFKTAAEACRKYDIKPTNMAHHLAGRMGFRQLKGLEFCFEEVQ